MREVTLYPYKGESLSIPAIAKRRNCSVETIRRLIKRHGPSGAEKPIGTFASGGRKAWRTMEAQGKTHPYKEFRSKNKPEAKP